MIKKTKNILFKNYCIDKFNVFICSIILLIITIILSSCKISKSEEIFNEETTVSLVEETTENISKYVIDARNNGINDSKLNNKHISQNVCIGCSSKAFLPLVSKIYENFLNMDTILAQDTALETCKDISAFYNFVSGDVNLLFAYELSDDELKYNSEFSNLFNSDEYLVTLLGKDGIVFLDNDKNDLLNLTNCTDCRMNLECKYYYYKNMFDNLNIDVKLIDGIMPNEENIKNGTYKLTRDFYMIVKKDYADNHKLKEIVDFMVSDDGKDFLRNLSYIVY